MQKLYDMIEWLNSDVDGSSDMDAELCNAYGVAMEQSLYRHYIDDRQRTGVRMSNLGKPAMILAFNKLGYTEPEPTGKARYIFHTGDMFENWFESMLQVYGIKILSTQGEVENMGISGHYDYLVEIDGEPVLLEAKTMNSYYANKFERNPDDERGYITQLAMYKEALGVELAAWVCLDKSNSNIFVVEPVDDAIFDDALDRARNVLNRLERVQSTNDIVTNFKAYPQPEEKFRGQYTGKFLVPPPLKYSPFKDVIYRTELGTNGYNKETEYVIEQRDAYSMQEKLDEQVSNGKLIKD